MVILNFHYGDFVAAKPTLDSFANRYSSVPREKLKKLFREQVEIWKNDTQHWSSVTRMLAHPSYLRIVGLSRKSTGEELERLLLQELEAEPDYWFDALAAITGAHPVQPEYDFDQAVAAWLEWGRREGILPH